jgi:hypothetical protein
MGISFSRSNPVPHWYLAWVLSLGSVMKLESMWEWSLRVKQKVVREPLYTLPEIADRLGMEHKTLANLVRNKHNKVPPPKAEMKPASTTRMKQNLYKLSEFKAWIKEMEEYK